MSSLSPPQPSPSPSSSSPPATAASPSTCNLSKAEMALMKKFADCESHIQQFTAKLNARPMVDVFAGLERIRLDNPGWSPSAMASWHDVDDRVRQTREWKDECDDIARQVSMMDTGDIALLRTMTRAAVQRDMSPEDTDLVEIAWRTLTAFDNLARLLNTRRQNVPLLILRLQWEQARKQCCQSFRALQRDLDVFIARTSRFSKGWAGNDRLGSGGQGQQKHAAFLQTEATDLARKSHTLISEGQSADRILNEMMDQCQVPNGFLDEQDTLDDMNETVKEKLTVIVRLSRQWQWEKTEELDQILDKLNLDRRALTSSISGSSQNSNRPIPTSDSSYDQRSISPSGANEAEALTVAPGAVKIDGVDVPKTAMTGESGQSESVTLEKSLEHDAPRPENSDGVQEANGRENAIRPASANLEEKPVNIEQYSPIPHEVDGKVAEREAGPAGQTPAPDLGTLGISLPVIRGPEDDPDALNAQDHAQDSSERLEIVNESLVPTDAAALVTSEVTNAPSNTHAHSSEDDTFSPNATSVQQTPALTPSSSKQSEMTQSSDIDCTTSTNHESSIVVYPEHASKANASKLDAKKSPVPVFAYPRDPASVSMPAPERRSASVSHKKSNAALQKERRVVSDGTSLSASSKGGEGRRTPSRLPVVPVQRSSGRPGARTPGSLSAGRRTPNASSTGRRTPVPKVPTTRVPVTPVSKSSTRNAITPLSSSAPSTRSRTQSTPPSSRPNRYRANPKNKLDVAVGQVVNKMSMRVAITHAAAAAAAGGSESNAPSTNGDHPAPSERDRWNDESGRYWVGHPDPKLCFCRILPSNTVMVRVGGGWEELSSFVTKHYAHLASVQSTPATSTRSGVEPVHPSPFNSPMAAKTDDLPWISSQNGRSNSIYSTPARNASSVSIASPSSSAKNDTSLSPETMRSFWMRRESSTQLAPSTPLHGHSQQHAHGRTPASVAFPTSPLLQAADRTSDSVDYLGSNLHSAPPRTRVWSNVR